jgi:hypothetical protein
MQDDDAAGDQVVLSHNLPAVAELLREQWVVTVATAELAMAKASYLQTEVESRRLNMLKHLVKLDSGMREKQFRNCMGVVKDNADTDLHAVAKHFTLGYMNGTLPSIDIGDVFRQLGKGLPGIAKIADIFPNAPALAPGNPFDHAHAPSNADTHSDVSRLANTPALSDPSAPAQAATSASASASTGFVAPGHPPLLFL